MFNNAKGGWLIKKRKGKALRRRLRSVGKKRGRSRKRRRGKGD